jgi:hypothetical protein
MDCCRAPDKGHSAERSEVCTDDGCSGSNAGVLEVPASALSETWSPAVPPVADDVSVNGSREGGPGGPGTHKIRMGKPKQDKTYHFSTMEKGNAD